MEPVDEVVVEVKAVDQLVPVHSAQLLTYLRLSGRRIGLLLNFKVERLKDGIVRRVLWGGRSDGARGGSRPRSHGGHGERI